MVLAAALDLLDVRRACRLEDGVLTRLVDAEFMEWLSGNWLERM